MSIPALSEATIQAHAAPESFSRGQRYYARGAVGGLVLRGTVLHADVEGSQYPAYRVRVTFDQAGVTSATCSCPYDRGGWCKHIVAALLAYIHAPNQVQAHPPLDAQLAGLDRAQLQALLLALAARDAGLADAIDRQLALLQLAGTPAARTAAAGSPRRSPIDQAAIRKQVKFALRPAGGSRYGYDYYDEEDPGGEVAESLRPLLAQAQGFVAAGDAASALALLEAVADEFFAGGELFEQIEEMFGSLDGALADFFDELAVAWAEALLSAELSTDERDEWDEKLAGWNDQADDLGAGAGLELAIAAAEQGWDYPPLRRVLAGEITAQGAWAGLPPEYADTLAQVRLKILERQGRNQEYIYLAEAEGQLDRYVLMLAKTGQAQLALTEGRKHLSAPSDILAVAGTLRERGALEEALSLAEHGLQQSVEQSPYAAGQPKAALGTWASELALGMGQPDRALRAAEVSLRAAPSLAAYRAVQDLAGEGWPELRPALLAQLRRSNTADAKVDIFLHEGLIDDAIAAVENAYDYPLLERVAVAAIAARPEWVITAASAQAERIMNSGKADRYVFAADWLRIARDAYVAAGRENEWRGYLQSIRQRHGRKYKLMGLIERL